MINAADFCGTAAFIIFDCKQKIKKDWHPVLFYLNHPFSLNLVMASIRFFTSSLSSIMLI